MIPASLSLPFRPLALPNRPLSPPRGFVFSVIVLAGLAAFFLYWQGPGLWRDWQISQDPVVIQDFNVDGDCRSRTGLTNCDAQVRYTYQGRSYDKDITLAFLDFTSGDYSVTVVISADDPEMATLSLGLDMLWNRLAVFAVLMALFVGGAIAMVWQAGAASRANGRIGREGRVALVPVEFTQLQEGGKADFASYAEVTEKGRSRLVAHSAFRGGAQPLLMHRADGSLYGLAARHEESALPVLLDRGLQRVTLMDRERAALLAAIEAEQADKSGAVAAAAKTISPMRRLVRGVVAFVAIIVLLCVGIVGYWVWYVTSSSTQFESLGMEINNLMPGPLNAWGCKQLEARFGDDRAPFGCTAADYVSWKKTK